MLRHNENRRDKLVNIAVAVRTETEDKTGEELIALNKEVCAEHDSDADCSGP